MTEPRYRINAKETAKGNWYFDATIEFGDVKKVITSKDDVCDIEEIPLGKILLQLIKDTEAVFINDGRQVIQGSLKRNV